MSRTCIKRNRDAEVVHTRKQHQFGYPKRSQRAYESIKRIYARIGRFGDEPVYWNKRGQQLWSLEGSGAAIQGLDASKSFAEGALDVERLTISRMMKLLRFSS